MELPERKIYSVSELTEEIKLLLEKGYPSVWVQGEVSNFRPAPSGHFYFTLKDEQAQIRCVMFRLQSRFLKFRPEDGLQVVAWGRLSVYSARGEYQLILDTMEPLGIGSLTLAFEQLRKRLAAEGLFDESRKKPLPAFPGSVGLVTSRRGAVVRDMVRIIGRRAPNTHILLSSATVQGDRAPKEIVAALGRLVQTAAVDVIIIGRGGGSIEDLWAFNDESVVRAVAGCHLPIVSAVGHETDFTLTDFAADVRASTPSAAAEMVVPDRRDLQDRIRHLTARLRYTVSTALEKWDGIVREAIRRLYDPRRKIEDRRQRLDELSIRLRGTMQRRLQALKQDTSGACKRLRPEHLRRKILSGNEERRMLLSRLSRSTRGCLSDAKNSMELLVSNLESLSPLAVLSRGYSVTMRLDEHQQDHGQVIKDTRTVVTGEEVLVRLHRGELECRVTAKKDPDGNGEEAAPPLEHGQVRA